MSFFTDPEVEEMASAEAVCLATLFEIRLASETLHYVEGMTDFTDVNGQKWVGMQSGVVRFDDASFTRGVTAEKRTYTLNAGDLSGLALSMVGEEQEYRWRAIVQYLQFFTETGQPVGAPMHVHTGLMDRLQFSMSPDGNATLRMTTETELVRKNASAYGYYTDTDQRFRYSDDAALERVALLSLGETIRWPDF